MAYDEAVVKTESGKELGVKVYFCLMFFPESLQESRTLHLSILDKTRGASIHFVK